MTPTEQELIQRLKKELEGVHPSVAIKVLEKLGKAIRRYNSARIYSEVKK